MKANVVRTAARQLAPDWLIGVCCILVNVMIGLTNIMQYSLLSHYSWIKLFLIIVWSGVFVTCDTDCTKLVMLNIYVGAEVNLWACNRLYCNKTHYTIQFNYVGTDNNE